MTGFDAVAFFGMDAGDEVCAVSFISGVLHALRIKGAMR